MDRHDDLELAHRLADLAAEIALRHAAPSVVAQLKVDGSLWDHASEVLILEEAGGRFRDPTGGRRLDLRGGTYTNGKLDAQVGAVLGRV